MANEGENTLLGPTNCPPAQRDDTRQVVPCVLHDWTVKLALAPNALVTSSDGSVPTDPNTLVNMIASPENPDVFQFRVAQGTFRRVHLVWPLTPYCPNVKVERLYQCSLDCCDTMTMSYEVSGCPLFLPPGDYTFTLGDTKICAPLSAEGAEYGVQLWLEYVTHDYLTAFMASGGGSCAKRCG